MNAFDVVMGVLVAGPLAWGLWKGLVRGVAGPASIIVAGVAGVSLALPAGRVLMPARPLGPVVGFIAVFVAAFLLVRLTGWALRRLVSAAGLAWADHLAGGLVGGALGVVVGAWMAAGLAVVLPGPPAFVAESPLLPYAQRVAEVTGFSGRRVIEVGPPFVFRG